MAVPDCDVAIVGAGPYGLASAAHLRTQQTLDVRVFGEPMSFWEAQMPTGMLLRSPYVASDIADPARGLTLDDYQSTNGISVPRPVPLEQFVEYGRWFQQQVAPDLDRRPVSQIARQNGGFRLTHPDGEVTTAGRVVVAAGISRFEHVPTLFSRLPQSLVSHSSAHAGLEQFNGKSVLVVGGGQSALESAALLHETGANVEVLVRAPRIYFLRRVGWIHRMGPLTKLLFAPAEVGPAGISRLVSAPSWYRRLPRRLQDRFAVRSLRPAGAAWLIPRLEGVPVTTGSAVAVAEAAGDRVRVSLDDGSTRTADHILLATGYSVDISRYEFLAPELLAEIARVGGYPRLAGGFETSVGGLHFVGAPAAWSYGPLLRFVAGTEYAGPTLARGILGKRSRQPR